MNNFKSSSELKAKAKGIMLGKYGTAISAFLTIQLIIFLTQLIVSGFMNTYTILENIIYYCVMFLMQLIAAILALGEARLYMNIACNFPYSVGDVFFGFTAHPDKVIIIQFMILLMEGLCMAPGTIFYVLYIFLEIPVLMLLGSILSVIGCIGVCLIALSYSQVNYLILDFPQYTPLEIMKLSKKLIKGHKGTLFYLYVSFLPLILLAFLTCCIGYLWVIPYINATNAQFYLELIRVKSSPPEAV